METGYILQIQGHFNIQNPLIKIITSTSQEGKLHIHRYNC